MQFKSGDKVVVRRGHAQLTMGAIYEVQQHRHDGYVELVSVDGAWNDARFELADPAPVGQAGGLKFDGGKAQWSLLLSTKGMLAAVKGVLSVLTFGANKYAAHSWREVEDNERRYSDALFRHLVAIQEHGLKAVDEESGLLHIDHLNCNGLFLAELARK